MKQFSLLLIVVLLLACSEEKSTAYQLTSPNNTIATKIGLNASGSPFYQIAYKGETVIDTSYLGFELREQGDLSGGFQILASAASSYDKTWEQPWGEWQSVRNHYQELRVQLEEQNGQKRRLDLVFRAFDGGVAFRYEFPEQTNLKELVIISELTQFNLTDDHTCWWIPANYDSYEHLYKESKISEIDGGSQVNEALAQVSIPILNAAHTPLTMKTAAGVYLSIHEADLTNYAGMTLRSEAGNLLECELVPWADGTKVKTTAPGMTPWRTIQIGDSPGALLESAMILNLNDPNALGDVSWVKPMRYMGIWWAMHLKKWTWDSGDLHGATTENAKAYIDFAAEHGFGGVLIEGWNLGWDRKEPFNYTKAYPDFAIEEVVNYGREKGVSLIGHHETYGAVGNYEKQLEDAMKFYGRLGVPAVKTGYVGQLLPDKEYHHGQWFVQHMQRVIDEAAKNKVAIVGHEVIKATGKRRTYPNMMARECLRGSEFNSPWGGGNPPEHLTIVPFTRMLAGPIDYTPGLFKLKLDKYKEGYAVPTTFAYQLAEYIVVYSPVHMASDLPEHYREHPEAFEFVKQVPVDFITFKVLDAEIGDYVTIARQEKNTGHWFVGSLTDEQPRKVTIDLSFLEAGKKYTADIYRDAADAHSLTNPEAYEIEKDRLVAAADTIAVNLAPGGGVAISLKPIDEDPDR
jgi:hypothetical protein